MLNYILGVLVGGDGDAVDWRWRWRVATIHSGINNGGQHVGATLQWDGCWSGALPQYASSRLVWHLAETVDAYGSANLLIATMWFDNWSGTSP